MANELYDAIRYIIDSSTDENIYNSKIFLSKLSDLAPNSSEEIKIFKRVITDDVLHRIILTLSLNRKNANQELIREKKRLEDEFGLSESWSSFIIQSFANAYNIDFEVNAFKSNAIGKINTKTVNTETNGFDISSTFVKDDTINYYQPLFDSKITSNNHEKNNKLNEKSKEKLKPKRNKHKHINSKSIIYLFLGALFNPLSLIIGIAMRITGLTRESREKGKFLCWGVVLSYFISTVIFVIYMIVSGNV